jgi:hypothetical protein
LGLGGLEQAGTSGPGQAESNWVMQAGEKWVKKRKKRERGRVLGLA